MSSAYNEIMGNILAAEAKNNTQARAQIPSYGVNVQGNASSAYNEIMGNILAAEAQNNATQQKQINPIETAKTAPAPNALKLQAQKEARLGKLQAISAPKLTPQQQEQQAAYEKYDTAIKQRDSLLKEQDSIDEQLRNITSRANVTGNGVTFANANDEAEYKRLEQRKEEIADTLATIKTPSVTGASMERAEGAYRNTDTAFLAAQEKLQGGNSEIDNLINNSIYAGYATDDLTRANMAQGGASSEPTLTEAAQKQAEIGQAKIRDANTKLQAAKDNTDAIGGFLIDAYSTGLDIAADTVVSLATLGIGGQVAMAARVFGMTAAEAADKGDDLQTQTAKGLTAAAIEVLTEKIGGAFTKVYGKLGGEKLGEATAKAVERLVRTDGGRIFATFLKETAEEGAQEALSDYLNILADHAFGWAEEGKSIEDDLKENKEQIIYDALLGAFVGAFGAGGNAIKAGRGGNANTQQQNTTQQQGSEIDNLVNAATKQAPQGAQESAQAITQQQTQPTQQTEPTAQGVQFNLNTETQNNAPAQVDTQVGTENATAAAIQRRGGTEETHISNRTMGNVGDRTVNAFQFDNPEIKPFYQQAAKVLQDDLALSTSYNAPQLHQTFSNKTIDRIMGEMSRNEAIDALQRIIDDSGLENAANAKRLEIILDDMLTHGYTPLNSDVARMPVNNDYIAARENVKGGTGNADEYRIQAAIEAEIEAALWDGEELSEENARKRVMQRYEETGYYSDADELRQREVGSNEDAETENADEYEGEDYSDEYGYEEYGEDENEPVYYETADRSGESEAPTVESVLENAKNRNAPAQNVEPVADKNGNYTLTAKPSKTADHTLRTIAEKLGGEQKSIYYVPTSERQTLTEAVNRVNADMVGEMSKLADKEMWTAADIDTALTIYGNLKADSITSGDDTAVDTWEKIVTERGSRSGLALQAFQKWTRTGAAQATTLVDIIKAADNLSEEQKTNLAKNIRDFARSFDSIKDGDLNGVRELIKRMNDYRGTGTFKAGRYEKLLNSIDDFDYLKEYAFRQIRAVVDDATSTASLAQKLKTWQTLSQLSRLTTFNRNIFGSGAFGIQDTIAQNAFGIAIDSVVSKYTGQKTVGLDKGWLDSDARKNAAKELNRAILEIAGDVNMLGDSTRYDMSTQRTNKMNGGKAARFMSRWEQGLGYSLSASDRYLRGQIEQSIRNSLAKSGLDEKNITNIAKQMADYRLFQNNGTSAQTSRDIKRLLNKAVLVKDPKGDNFGLGDLLNKYPAVPANLGVKALEYSPANIIKGIKQVSEVVNDAKAGKLDAAKQNEAVMNIARGMSGAPLVAALVAFFKTGLVRNSDDEDDPDARAQNAAEGKSGVQINLSAIGRAINHESVEWKDGDNLMSVGWLEPLNAFMAIASLIATDEDDSIPNVAVNYIDGTIQGVLDLPVMQNVQSMLDTWNYSTADSSIGKAWDVTLDLAGNAATGMMPAPFAQTAKTIDPYFRDTSSNSEIGQILNNIVSNTPGFRQFLPVKLDNYGEPKRYADSEIQRLLNNFILPGAVNDLHQTDVSAAIEEVYNATENAGVYPDRKAPNSFSHDKVKYALSNDEKYTYHETYGQAFEENVQALISSYNWQYRWSDEEKAEAIIKAEKQAEETAKKELVNARGGKW